MEGASALISDFKTTFSCFGIYIHATKRRSRYRDVEVAFDHRGVGAFEVDEADEAVGDDAGAMAAEEDGGRTASWAVLKARAPKEGGNSRFRW